MPLTNKHIVAIDDTHSILTFLRISLEAQGAIFHAAATASGGLALCESVDPDLVVLDINLPDKEGFDILPRIKHLAREKHVPVIILTVHKEQEARDQATRLGASGYLTKPFIMDDLLEMIHHELDPHQYPGNHLRLVN
jgi:two-component system OmpR family response regulator